MKKILIPVFTIALLFATSCKKEFFAINDNPNSPTEASITPKVLLPRILHSVGNRVGTLYNYAAFWTGYWARSGTYGQSIEIESYQITATYEQTQWSGWYDILFDVSIMEKQAKALNQPFYEGAAKAVKALGFMYLVDQYNNVPYSKAFDVSGNLTPAYDKAEDIYTDLFAQLDAAAKLMATATVDSDISAADVMFAGDKTSWRKFINTLRLRLLIHESQVVAPATVSSVVAQITADGSGYLIAGKNAAVNPGYTVVLGKQNPFWDTFKVTALGVTDQYNRANTYILNKFAGPDGRLAANNPATPAGDAQAALDAADDDVRYQYVFSKALVPLDGPQFGFPAQTPKPLYNYIGAQFGEIVPNSDPYKAANQSDVAGPGLAKAATQPQQILTATESLFLQSEAAARGWIPGDAATLLTAAITESYTFLGVTKSPAGATVTPAAAATSYIAARGVLASLAAAGSPLEKSKVIAMQKYYALIGLDNFEAYVDYRRLGVPTDLPLSLNPGRLSAGIPLRLQYPQAEFNYNTANVNGQGVINPQTSTIFWDK
jgi:hypothetical protein